MTGTLIRVAGQNMTEGPVTPAVAAMDVVIGQEVDRLAIRRGLPDFRHHFPERDSHQSISWDPSKLRHVRSGYIRFHRSGEAEGWPFGTPARGLIWVHLQPRACLEVDLVVAGWWALNSWDPVREDRHTGLRERIVRTATLPKVRRFVRHQHNMGRLVVMEADANSLEWDGNLPEMRQVKRQGLDRAWVSDPEEVAKGRPLAETPRLRVRAVTDGPQTGRGGQMRHHSVHLSVAVGR